MSRPQSEVRIARQRAGIKQPNLAAELGIYYHALAAIEKCTTPVTPEYLAQIFETIDRLATTQEARKCQQQTETMASAAS